MAKASGATAGASARTSRSSPRSRTASARASWLHFETREKLGEPAGEAEADRGARDPPEQQQPPLRDERADEVHQPDGDRHEEEGKMAGEKRRAALEQPHRDDPAAEPREAPQHARDVPGKRHVQPGHRGVAEAVHSPEARELEAQE